MVIKVIFDDNSNDIIYSHMLQFGIEFGFNGRKIKMFYRDAEKAWVAADTDFLRKSIAHTSHYGGPERRNDAPLASYRFNPSVAGSEPEHESARRINAVNCCETP